MTKKATLAQYLFKTIVMVLLATSVIALSACTNNPKRTAGTVIDDQTLEYEVINNIYSDPAFGQDDHIKVDVHQGMVLLAGETTTKEKSTLASQLAENTKMTKRVVNDLKVGKRADFGDKAGNSWLTTKVKVVLIKENPLPGFDASRIKVVSSKHTVYLMGLVTHKEGDAVTEIVRNIGNVEKVVKIFNYTD